MKKFLALFLVLVMALSCLLISCKGRGDDPEDTSDNEWVGTPAPTTTPTPTTAPNQPSRPSDQYSWTEDKASTTVYIRIDALNVRNDTIINDSTTVGVAKFGESYTRIKYNDQWTMISYNGKECYVSTAYITTDNGSVVFKKVDEKTVYINVETTLNLRTSTYVTNPDGTKYESNIYAPVKRGVAVTQNGVSENGNWARVIYEGQTLYCNTAYLSDRVPSDDTNTTPTPTPTPVG